MLRRSKRAGRIGIAILLLCYTFVCSALVTSVAFAELSDEEGLRLRRQRKPKKSVAQMFVYVPTEFAKLPFRIIAAGMKYTILFMDYTRLPARTKALLSSDDGLNILYPVLRIRPRQGFTGDLAFYSKKFLKPGDRLNLYTSYSTKGHQEHHVRYRGYRLIGGLDVDLRGRVEVDTNRDFYGIGPNLGSVRGDGDLRDRTNYRYGQSGASLTIGTNLNKRVRTELLVNYRNYTIADGEDTTLASILAPESPFNDNNTPGLDGAAFLGVGGRVSLDARDNDFYPSKGYFAAASATLFNQTDSDKYGFVRYNFEVSHYSIVSRIGQIFAVQLMSQINSRTPAKEVPFFTMASLGGSSSLRGYATGRFLEKSLILLHLEYRYPIWDVAVDRRGALDAVLFVDFGRVFDQITESTFEDYKMTYGAGIRARTPSDFLFRAEIARSDEEVKVIFKLSPLF